VIDRGKRRRGHRSRIAELGGCWAYETDVSGDGVTDATAETEKKALALAVLPNL
jgi:hypothetical protein